MTDSMKFGPEWLRNLKGGDTSSTPPSAPIKMAEFRYGREEMLALFDRATLPPDPVRSLTGLYVDKTQPPLALVNMTDDETRMWNRGINSEVSLRLGGGGPGRGGPALSGARGGSVDRGRGRARGSYHYTRGLSYDESDGNNGYNNHQRPMRPYDRNQGGGVGWGERNGGDPGDYTATSPRKEFSQRSLSDTNWRRQRFSGGGDDDEGWRPNQRSDKWTGRGGSNHSWREGEGGRGSRPWDEANSGQQRRPWDGDDINLPEWATENPSESGGCFDASGAFHGGSHHSDDDEARSREHERERDRDREREREKDVRTKTSARVQREPSNITNGATNSSSLQHQHSDRGERQSEGAGRGGRGPGPLRQSQSASSLTTEHRPASQPQQTQPHQHPITSSASFSGVESKRIHPTPGSEADAPKERREKGETSRVPVSSSMGPAALDTNQTNTTPANTTPANTTTTTTTTTPPYRQSPEKTQPQRPPPSEPSTTTSPPYKRPEKTQPQRPSSSVERTTHEEEMERRLRDAADVLVSRLMEEEEREPPPPSPSASTPPAPSMHSGNAAAETWYYQDPQCNVQGPFRSSEMLEWYLSGYFKDHLLVRRACDQQFCPLRDLKLMWNGNPFILDYYSIPPIKNTESSAMPVLDETAMQLQMQMQQMQERLALQRHAQAQVLATLSQSEQFKQLPLEQQQMLAHQAQLHATAGMMPLTAPAPVPTPAHTQAPTATPNVLAFMQQLAHMQKLQQTAPLAQAQSVASDPVQQLMAHLGLSGGRGASGGGGAEAAPQSQPQPPADAVHQMMAQMGLQPPVPRPTPVAEDQRTVDQFINAFRQRQAAQPQTQSTTMESVWGGAAPAPTYPGWVSSTQPAPSHPTLWADPKPSEQNLLEEAARAEERQREDLRKQEERQRRLEEEERERERLRKIKEEEELLKKKKEEEEREKERKRLHDEEEKERKKKEAAAKKEQDRLRKEEEKKKKEEEKRRKEEEKKKLEDEKKKADEEKKRLEEEKKRKEEQAKRQNEALRRIQEQQQAQARVKPSAAPWSAPEPAPAALASLADIQKTERKQQQLLREQQEMLRAYERSQLEQQQQLEQQRGAGAAGGGVGRGSGTALNLKWAEGGASQPARVKSLTEIQHEEQEQVAKQAERDKAERIAAAKEVPAPATGSIWASATHSLTWAAQPSPPPPPSVWGTASVGAGSGSGSGNGGGPKFWEEVSTAKQQTAKQPAAKSQTKTKAKREEANVMKLFEKQIPKTAKTDGFNQWCTKTLAAYAYTVDIPTFVDFLLSFESPREVREYVRMYLGETKEATEFAAEFLDRRGRLVTSEQRSEPSGHVAPPTPAMQTNHFQEVKNKNKKVKKNKMTKVDSRILGFNVTAAPDRINVGDRDYGEA